ncbi:hypothetical protein I5907_01025 [Panacibacter sp. DH6]|uniref:Copper resistance protein NlpE n=1 Tax=Panacibacter microcysteis TaxID=2793269 RepID=A0A931GTX9_9BACT|nr:hypothetical protein [Panacibacter microcysteis]MBG9374800.1 hypothetical protein [Panacibacter microcysteis]
MKKVLLFLMVATVMACNNGDRQTSAHEDSTSLVNEPAGTSAANNNNADTSTTNNITLPGQVCFRSVVQRDTVYIKLNIKDTLVFGELEYNMYEKDDNKGKFKGLLVNNILTANYTFRSEGTLSARQVMFKLDGETLTEGFGEMVEKDNRFVFKNPSEVQFTQVYKRIDCK